MGANTATSKVGQPITATPGNPQPPVGTTPLRSNLGQNATATAAPNPGFISSFSGADVKAIIHIPNDRGFNPTMSNVGIGARQHDNAIIALQGLQTLSISIYRDKSPVRSLGFVNPIGNTRGGRTIAGSMIFAILKKHPLWELHGQYTYDYNNEFGWGWAQGQGPQFFPDAAPPFNLRMVFSN